MMDLRRQKLRPGRTRRVGRVAVGAAAVVAFLALAACTGAPPEVTRAQTTLVYVDDLDLNAMYETLTLDVHVQDADGIDDLQMLHVTHDASGLVWTITRERWERRQQADAEVFTLSGLATADGGPIPRGRYRVIAVDAAGHTAELTTTVAGAVPGEERLRFPRLEIRGDTLSVTGGFPLVVLRGYDVGGRFVGELRLSEGEDRTVSEIAWLRKGDAEIRLVLSAVDPETGLDVQRGPY
ncbi:MAG: hypothetical protein GVY14_04980 [Spirochaetes bacterium]|jgi:hypothetical protein|nr:hypothetical protein [Spirochaetota bacterium]